MKSAVDDATDAAQDAADAVGDAATTATDAAGDLANKTMDALGEGFTAAAEKASSALASVEGGPEALKGIKDLFGSAHESLSKITDEASAKAALPGLEDLDGKVTGLGELLAKLPAEAKPAIASLIDNGREALQKVVDKIVALPGVETVIKPKLDAIMEKLSALTAA
jgi:hypothetical protein